MFIFENTENLKVTIETQSQHVHSVCQYYEE